MDLVFFLSFFTVDHSPDCFLSNPMNNFGIVEITNFSYLRPVRDFPVFFCLFRSFLFLFTPTLSDGCTY